MSEHNSFETQGLTVLIMFRMTKYLKLQSHIFKVLLDSKDILFFSRHSLFSPCNHANYHFLEIIFSLSPCFKLVSYSLSSFLSLSFHNCTYCMTTPLIIKNLGHQILVSISLRNKASVLLITETKF